MRYQHVVSNWTIVTPITAKKQSKGEGKGEGKGEERGSLCVFEGVVIVGIGSWVYTIVESKSS
jgi:hypothetical protein